MLRDQRLLAFANRVHTYILCLFLFFVFAWLAGSYFQVDEAYISFLRTMINIAAWTVYVYGVWILVLIVMNTFRDHMFPLKFTIITLIRLAVTFIISLISDLIEHIVTQGVTIGLS